MTTPDIFKVDEFDNVHYAIIHNELAGVYIIEIYYGNHICLVGNENGYKTERGARNAMRRDARMRGITVSARI